MLLSIIVGFLVSAAVIGWQKAFPVGALSYVMLTWRNPDTSHTMTVVYQTRNDPGTSKIYYDTESRNGDLSRYSYQQTGQRDLFKEVGRYIHGVELTGLRAKTKYYFVVADKTEAVGSEYSFRTLPADDSPVRIVTGGDVDITNRTRKITAQAAKFNPDLVVIGGDIAYANGELDNSSYWDAWLKHWSRSMVTDDGRLIPFIAAIGNHDVNGSNSREARKRAPFFTRFLKQDDNNYTYFARKLAANTGLVVLDTNYLHSAEGSQQIWLDQQLSQFRNLPYRIAVYHKPLYPGGIYPRVGAGVNQELIDAWLNIFDRNALTLALENHYHVHKRTKALFQNAIAAKDSGTVYLGDGAWGTRPRRIANNLWYVETANSKNHFWVIDISNSEIAYQAIDAEGNIFDHGRRINQFKRDAASISGEANSGKLKSHDPMH